MRNEFIKKTILFTFVLALALAAPMALADVQIAPWYPQGMNYVFECSPGFNGATKFDWSFGDGQKLIDMSSNNVYHTYESAGTYEVTCTASNGVTTDVSILRITAGAVQDIPQDNISVSLDIAPYFPQGPNGENYVFECNANGFAPTSFDWDFGDGQKLHDISNQNVWHTYAPGSYAVECTASDGTTTEIGEIHIIVGGIQEEPTEVQPATVSVAPSFPQGLDYIFNCETSAFTAATYTWDFGDGQKLVDVSNNNVWHTYSAEGTYTVGCDAKDSTGSQLAKGSLTVDATA